MQQTREPIRMHSQRAGPGYQRFYTSVSTPAGKYETLSNASRREVCDNNVWQSVPLQASLKSCLTLTTYKNVLNTSAWTMWSMVQCKSLEATFFIAKRRIGTGNFCTKHSFQCLPCTVCLLHSCTAALCQMHLLLWCAPWVPTITVRWLVIMTLGIP